MTPLLLLAQPLRALAGNINEVTTAFPEKMVVSCESFAAYQCLRTPLSRGSQ